MTYDPIYLWYILWYIILLQYNVYIGNRYLISDDLSINMTIYGMILNYSFNFRSSAAIFNRHPGFKTYNLTLGSVKYIIYNIKPKTSDNASK